MTLYNSPKLFDRSACLVDSFSANEKKHRFLFFSTLSGLEKTEAFQKSFGKAYELYILREQAHNRSAEVYENGNVSYMPLPDYESHVTDVMKKQKIGTQLYIAAEWDIAKYIFNSAIEAGFMEEEIQVIVFGEKERHAYCPSCYTRSAIPENSDDVQCPKCEVRLSVSPFFSKVRGGYLGYPYVD